MIKILSQLKRKIPVIIPVFVLPFFINICAFCIDIAPVNIFSFAISYIVVCALFTLVYGVFGKIWASWFITSIPVFLLEIINFYKLKINATPFVLGDLSFIGGLGEIVGFALPQIKITSVMIIGIAGYLLVSAAIIITECIYKKTKTYRISLLCTGLIIAAVLFIPFSHKAIVKLSGNQELSSHQLVMKNGVITGIYCSLAESDETVMALTQTEIQSYIDSYPKSENDTKPTVIFLMSESFFDVYRLPGITYSKDPIPNFHKLKDEFSSGSFISNAYCGGTGYVEMEFLTGLCSRYLSEGHTLDNLPDKEVYKYIPSISDVFKKNGYTTSFIHSYNTNLYNRPFIYSSFEFDNVKFDTDFTVPIEYSGGYISDDTLVDEIIATYEENKDNSSMIYAISMENHQPFLQDKYDEKSGIEIYSDLSEEDTEAYEIFLHGLHNADRSLGKITEYFSKVDEPVIIAFWGDHLPNLTMPSGSSIYKQTGYCDDTSLNLESKDYYNQLTTDYVIWSNYELEKVEKNLGCPTFAIEVLEKTGIEMTDYFKWMSNRVKDTYLVLSYFVFASADGVSYPGVPEQHKEVMDEYKQVVEDIVYGEHKFFGQQR